MPALEPGLPTGARPTRSVPNPTAPILSSSKRLQVKPCHHARGRAEEVLSRGTARPRIHAPPIPPRAPRSHPPRTRPLCVRFSRSDGVCVPCAQQQPNRPSAQTGSNPDACNDAMGGLRLGPGGGGCSSIAQSLPSHSHMAMHAAPRKPRVHPSPAPSFAGVPLMALRRVEYVCPRSSLRPPTGRCSVLPGCIQGTCRTWMGCRGTAGHLCEHALHAAHRAVHMPCTHSPCA